MEKCMGCLGIAFGSRRRKNRLRYRVNYGNKPGESGGIEFNNLILEDDDPPINYGTSHHFVSQEEKDIIAKREYDKILEQQRKIDEQINRQTFEEEERLRIEEERFREAQLEASRAVSAALKVQQYSKGSPASKILPESSLYSVDDSSESDEDFETFLKSVKTRSDAFRQNKTDFCKSVPVIDSKSTNCVAIVSSQPKKLTFKTESEILDFKDRDIDGIADGMSSDGSFVFDNQLDNVEAKNVEAEWDTFVDGLEKHGGNTDLNEVEVIGTS